MPEAPLLNHIQSEGNANYRSVSTTKDDEEDPLTLRGRSQAQSLGKEFKDVRIDRILASFYARATQTAQGIANEHCEPVTVDQTNFIVEREIGEEARSALRRQDSYAYDRLVNGWGSYPNFDRQHVPPGGESLDQVALRAKIALVWIAFQYGKNLGGERPENEEWWKSADRYEGRRCKPGDIPEDIPHIVVVSHNIFLCEFYELLLNWGREKHETTSTNYWNTDWYVSSATNHIVYPRPDTLPSMTGVAMSSSTAVQ